jgi:hypothetical protein
MVRSLVTLGTLLLLVPSCEFFGPDEEEHDRDLLRSNRQKWAAQGISDYDLRVNTECFGFCIEPDVLVQVRGGQRVAIVDPDTDALLFWVRGPDVDELFEQVERAVTMADRFTVRYDRELGFVRDVDIDFDRRAVDDEFAAHVVALMVTDDPVRTIAERVVDRRVQWETGGVDDYDFRLEREGVGVPDIPCGTVRIEVRDAVVVSRIVGRTGEMLDPSFDEFYPPLDDLFDVIEMALGEAPDVLDAGFDGQFGFPNAILIDFDDEIPGRELYLVWDFLRVTP